LLDHAKRLELFVRIDMESSIYTERTLRLFREMHGQYPNVGIVLQANLRRTEIDVERLIPAGADIRLVKGAYLEPPFAAYEAKRDVDENYLRLLDRLWRPDARERGVRVAVATHDERIIRWAIEQARGRGIAPGQFQFEMLYGIRRDLQRRLVRDGYRVLVYVPYGEQWYAYLMRRLAERPANLLFVLRNAIRS
jgi:proline dehydrogenase